MNPDDQKIRAIVQDELQRQGNKDTFGVSAVPRHVHNGVDAPFVFNNVATYAGIIVLQEPALLPKGWGFKYISTGEYQLQHNLGFDQVVWTLTPIGAGGATLPLGIAVPGGATVYFPKATGTVGFSWFDANGGAASIDTAFYFTAVVVNNADFTPAQYTIF